MANKLTTENLRDIKHVIGDMRFMQAAALVASGTAEDKKAREYMSKLSGLEKLLDEEIKSIVDAHRSAHSE